MWVLGALGMKGLMRSCRQERVNPFTLRAAKRGLPILEISYLQEHFLENIQKKNVDQKPNNNSPSNIF